MPQGPPHTCTSSSRPPAARGLQSAEPRGHLRQQRDQPARRRGLRLRLRLHAGPVLGHAAPGDLQRRPRPPGRVLQGEAGPPWGVAERSPRQLPGRQGRQRRWLRPGLVSPNSTQRAFGGMTTTPASPSAACTTTFRRWAAPLGGSFSYSIGLKAVLPLGGRGVPVLPPSWGVGARRGWLRADGGLSPHRPSCSCGAPRAF